MNYRTAAMESQVNGLFLPDGQRLYRLAAASLSSIPGRRRFLPECSQAEADFLEVDLSVETRLNTVKIAFESSYSSDIRAYPICQLFEAGYL